MTIVTSECLSENSKSPMKMTKKETEDSTSDLFDDIITDNPLIFRVCCFCLMRSRQRIKPEADEISRSCESAKSEHSKDSEWVESTFSSFRNRDYGDIWKKKKFYRPRFDSNWVSIAINFIVVSRLLLCVRWLEKLKTATRTTIDRFNQLTTADQWSGRRFKCTHTSAESYSLCLFMFWSLHPISIDFLSSSTRRYVVATKKN